VTVSKGAAWGARAPRPSGTIEAGDDRGARQAVEQARRAGEAVPPLCLRSGDLWRTVGGPQPGTQQDALVLPADLALADLDGEERCFVAHLVARRSWWRGRVVAVMNAQFLGTWDVAPRSHPNDGRLDVVDVASALSGTDRWRARRRLPSGTYVPHPSITVRQTSTWTTTFDEPTPVWLDGERVGEVLELSVRAEPDALVLVM
jgi:hypothetical protein